MRRIHPAATRRFAGGVLVLTALAACATNPVTGRRQLALISESQEIELGRQSAEQASQSIGLVDDEALQQYVHRIGTELARDSERPNLPWTFRVVDDPTPNAFALPGGFIFVTRGLMSLLESEAELAAVLGHEIGHVTARHSVAMISRAQLAQIGLGVGSILFPTAAQTFGGLAQGGLSLLFLRYSRDAERQADELGFRYSLRENYDVREMDDVFAQLAAASAREAEGRSALPSWLNSHPGPEERIRNVQARLATLPADSGTRQLRNEYLNRIDGLVYGDNPRQGFFRGGLFLHPDLRFQMRFPEGWRTQNMTQAVVAVSPRQDAIIQLTLAGRQGAESAARAFLSQQGIAPGQSFRDNIAGSTAVSSYFQAQTQQGVIAGLATFLDFGGTTYQILSYAPSGAFRNHEGTFRAVSRSFTTLTDPEALNIRPNRVDVVRAPRAMTLAQFAQQYPSSVTIEELALINQVRDGSAQIPAGTLVKRVVRQ